MGAIAYPLRETPGRGFHEVKRWPFAALILVGCSVNLATVAAFYPTPTPNAWSCLQPSCAPPMHQYSCKCVPQISRPSQNKILFASKIKGNKDANESLRMADQAGVETHAISVPFSGGIIEFSWHDSIGEIAATAWDNCLPTDESKGGETSTDLERQHRRSPFLEHAWIHCLEDSGCASVDTGWTPRHVSMQVHSKRLEKAAPTQQPTATLLLDNIDGCVPAYIKTHSKGEFIFDSAWADVAHKNGLDYYPKLLVGVPFTPVSGSRILWHTRIWETFSQVEMNEMNLAVGDFLKESAMDGIPLVGVGNCSSVHINFSTDAEATILAGELEYTPPIKFSNKKDDTASTFDAVVTSGQGKSIDDGDELDAFEAMLRQLEQDGTDSYLRRISIQYHWINQNPLQNGQPFRDFADYLSCFRSKKRINIKRERAKAQEDGKVRIDAIRGADILKVEGLVDRMFEIYLSTVDKMLWGRQYLTLDFFQRLSQTSFIHNLCFMCARNAPEKELDNKDSTPGDKSDDSNNGQVIPALRAEDVFAGTFNVVKDGVFYGRYWGCLPNYEVKNLHFETCYWSSIEYCIKNGLHRMEPGAGGADYKWARGFDPQLVHSVHFIVDPWLRRAVRQYLKSETEYNVAVRQHLLDRSSMADRFNV